jgi:hypothetical protein
MKNKDFDLTHLHVRHFSFGQIIYGLAYDENELNYCNRSRWISSIDPSDIQITCVNDK